MARKPEQAAEQLLAALHIDGPPIPVDDIAASLGTQVVYEPLRGDISGMLFHDQAEGGPTVIGVNAADAPVRQRFTIAHELGHLRLHPGKPMIIDKLVRVDFRDDGRRWASDRQEREANQFAASLLMPEQMIREQAAVTITGAGSISEERVVEGLAKTFNVSRQAMLYRLVNLGILSPFALEGG